MKHVSTLTDAERSALTQMYEQGHTHRLRQRAHAILLSSQGYTREHLALLFTVHVDTVSRWLDNWIQDGLGGLADAPKSGRPRKITPELENTLRTLLEQPTPQLRALVEAELQKNIQSAWITVKRALRRLGATFRRARRLPARVVCPRHRARVQRALTRLHRLEQAGKCCVWYADESGFCLQPPLPYLWQNKGQTLGLPSQAHTRRYNVLGFLRRDCTLHSAPTEQTVTADHFVASVEALGQQQGAGPHIVVVDNATIRRSKAVRQKRRAWKARGIRLLFLPPYSPHLNKIERLWRHIKYHWLAPDAYKDFATLRQSVNDLLAQVGTKHCISFD